MSENNTPHPIVLQAKNYTYITSQQQYAEVIAAIEDWPIRPLGHIGVPAIDFETTSLVPNDGDIVLTSIYNLELDEHYLINHRLAGSITSMMDAILARPWVVCNAKFEGRWLDYWQQEVGSNKQAVLYDIAFMRAAKMGGGPSASLKDLAAKNLKLDLDKSHQDSDWRRDLTKEQLDYAALDSVVTAKVYEVWCDELTPQHWGGFLVMNNAWRATAEAEDTGLFLDAAYHSKLVDLWSLKFETARRYLRKWAPESLIANLNSRQQVGTFIKANMLDDDAYRAWPKTDKTQQMELSSSVLRQASYRLPYPMSRWLAALLVYNYYAKYLSTYGQKLLDMNAQRGKITSRFNVAGAITGRYSSSNANLQNIPRSAVVRRSFVAVPFPNDGEPRKLILADYSSIEVRVLAEISGDAALLREAVYGDVHAASAAAWKKIPLADFIAVLKDKAHPLHALYKGFRSKAKAITFSVCYGAGIPALAVSLRVTDAEAYEAIQAWAARYPKAYGYRQYMFEKLQATGFIDVVDGRSIYVFKDERTLPVASNYGIQGAAASVMLCAMERVREALESRVVNARIAATVHDEILLLSREDCAEDAKQALIDGMVAGWLDVFPNSVTENLMSAEIGTSWADKA